MVISLLLLAKNNSVWEHRVGSYQATCARCNQPTWQLLYRLYITQGTTVSPATPYGPFTREAFQVRCSTCWNAQNTAHPATWTPQMGPAFVQEQHPVMQANSHYASMAFAGP